MLNCVQGTITPRVDVQITDRIVQPLYHLTYDQFWRERLLHRAQVSSLPFLPSSAHSALTRTP